MVFPGHIAAGYLTALGVVTFAGLPLSPNEQTILLTVGALLGDAPDIDVFVSFFRKKTTDISSLNGHRDYITHTPILWLLAGFLVIVLTGSPFGQILGLLLWLCPWSHLVCDSMFSSVGVQWLRPFSHTSFTLFRRQEVLPKSWKGLIPLLLVSPLFYIEILLACVALAVIIIRNI